MSSDSGESQYLDALLKLLPEEYDPSVTALLQSPSNVALVETMLRLTGGGPCLPTATPPIRYSWAHTQSRVEQAFQALSASTSSLQGQPLSRAPSRSASTPRSDAARVPSQPPSRAQSRSRAPAASQPAKRKRGSNSPSPPLKKSKPTRTPPPVALVDGDDPPRFTLYAVSISAPFRKRYDITIHAQTLRFEHTGTHALEASYHLAALARAFIVPTLGKSKPHWTVILASHDAPPPAKPTAAHFHIVFGVDAAPAALYRTAAHPAAPVMHAKHTPTRPMLDAFLAHLPPACPRLEPAPGSGVHAYRGAKEYTLWFMNEGLLCQGKDCEFWPLEDLMREEQDGDEAVRIMSATGRLCAVHITRKPRAGEEDAEGELTEFTMIDGKAQPEMKEWVRTHRRWFGRTQAQEGAGAVGGEGSAGPSGGGEDTAMAVDDDDDDDDSDFEVSSEQYDGGSPSSSSSGSSGGRVKRAEKSGEESESVNSGSDDEGSGEENADDDDEGDVADEDAGEQEEPEDGPLDPRHHPLMRPGAVPKMSRAAMDAAVELVVGDLVGGPSGSGARAHEEDEEDDELDE
ncbi:hypothetical protein FA95DRAFT_1553432 [Auriscalpium vulgare]|uniref:Uncharacterized protein n=1 Tax=Auriscalpium vulgare TaxID=40419 RepID=A0ACB8S936_9AGAM|nr:hypothetical protein FA95DRAFT_1553432 [Auriscalpium vulgare]